MDFLSVDSATMTLLLASAVRANVHGHELLIPTLPDLLAMKIFSLAHNVPRRMSKDLPDIAHLGVLHNLDIDTDIRPLCDRFGTPEVLALIRGQMEAMRT